MNNRRKKVLTARNERLPALPDNEAAAQTVTTSPPRPTPPPVPVLPATVDGVQHCRFTMFVQLKPGVPSKFKDLQRIWTYRGDKFTTEEPKMLKNLLQIIVNHGHDFHLMQISDHLRSKQHGQVILKIYNGTIREDYLQQYSDYLTNYPFQKIVNKYPYHEQKANSTED